MGKTSHRRSQAPAFQTNRMPGRLGADGSFSKAPLSTELPEGHNCCPLHTTSTTRMRSTVGSGRKHTVFITCVAEQRNP